MKNKRNQSSAPADFAKLVKSYVGFLQGVGKGLATVESYRGDLSLFGKFLEEREKQFYHLTHRDFAAFSYWMERQGLRINTRRRKILSAKSFVKYAVSRKKMSPLNSNIRYVPVPDRLERLPWIPKEADLRLLLSVMETESVLGLRNRIVVQTLAETGMNIAELCALRWEDWQNDQLTVPGKKHRALTIPSDLRNYLQAWRAQNSSKYLFPGYNRYGMTTERMTARGVELLFRALAKKTGLRSLKPKSLRHYRVVLWLKANRSEAELQKALGVSKTYSFESYRKYLERV